MYHSKYNLSFNIGVLSAKDIRVVNNGADLAGDSRHFFNRILFFKDWVFVKYIELPRTKFRLLKALRDSTIDVSAHSHTLEILDRSNIDAFNASILPTYNVDICHFGLKSMRSKPKASNCIKAVSEIFSIRESYLYSFCFILLLISLWFFGRTEKKQQVCRSKNPKRDNSTGYTLKLIGKKATSVLAILVPAFFIWLFGAHYSTDCAIEGESSTLNRIQEFDSWPIEKIFHILDSCGYYYNEQIVRSNRGKYEAETASQYESIEKIAKTEPGPLLLISSANILEMSNFFYCYAYQKDCEKHYFHKSEPFGEVLGIQVFGKNIGRKKIRFLLRYAYSMHENGMWLSIRHKMREDVTRVFGSESMMQSARRINSNWRPLTMSFMSISWRNLLVSILFSSLVLILLEIIPAQHQNTLNKSLSAVSAHQNTIE